jgi:putative transposase
LAEKCRLIYNFALKERRDHWEQMKLLPEPERTFLSYTDQQNQLPATKAKYPEYRWVYSKVLQMALQKLDADYKSFFALAKADPAARPPRFKGKQHFTTLCYNQSGFKVACNGITFSHKHPSNVPLQFELAVRPREQAKQAEIFRDQRGRWFVSLTYEAAPPPYAGNGKYLAIDLGVANLVSAVNLEGKFLQVPNRRANLYWKGKLAEVQSKRDHCKKDSNRWKRYNSKLCQMQRKCASQLRDFQHKISKKIVTNTKANTIVIGDLDVKEMAASKHGGRKADRTLHHSVQNTGSLGRFAQFVAYKAELAGKRVVRVGEAFTSQVCAKCGKTVKRKLSERTIRCDCGHELDRDLNAAANILAQFLLSQGPAALSHEPAANAESFLREWGGFAATYSDAIPARDCGDSQEAPAFMRG